MAPSATVLVAVLVVVVLLVLLAVVGGWTAWAWAQGDGGVVRRLGARPADDGDAAVARLHNLVEGLGVAAGVAKPSIYVVDDAAPNALAAGTGRGKASLVVTSGLLDSLSRIELEGVVAHELVRIKSGAVARPTLVANALGPLAPKVAPRLRAPETVTDVAAVAVTRYPPGLTGALEKMRPPSVARPAVDHLWLVPPGAALAERIDALREL